MRIPHVTEVECEDIATGTRHRGAQLSNISLGGVYVEGIPTLREGSLLRLWFTLPSLRMDMLAEVVHTTPSEGMGLRFGHLPPVHQVVIQELMRGETEGASAGDEEASASEEGSSASESAAEAPKPASPEKREEAPAEQEDPFPDLPPLPSRVTVRAAPEAESESERKSEEDPFPDLPPLPGGATVREVSAVTSEQLNAATRGASEAGAEERSESGPEPETARAASGGESAAPAESAAAAGSGASAEAPGDGESASAPAAETPASAPAEASDGERRRRVLVVDDHDRTRAMLRGMIEGRQREYEVTEARDGQECVEVVQSHPPFDLIFLDVDMPRLNGLGACKKLRELGVKSPIIFLTGRGEMEDFRAGREAGADTYIKKPIVLGTLRSMLGLFTSGALSRR